MGNFFHSKRFFVLLAILWVVLLAALLQFWLQGKGLFWYYQELPVPMQAAQPSGHGPYSYSVPMGTQWLSQIEKYQSPVQLYEDGKLLGPGNSLHADIGAQGGGRFSLWKDGFLYFSSSDNSDPRTNGHKYVLKQLGLSPRGMVIAYVWIICVMLGLMVTVSRIRRGLVYAGDTFIKNKTLSLTRLSQSVLKAFQTRMHTRITYEELLDWSCVLLLLGFAFYAVAPFLDRLYLYVFEGDAEATVAFASAFARFFYSFDIKALPGLQIYPPDFDAQFIIYGAARVIVDGLVHVGVIAPSLVPNEQSLSIFAIRHVNLLAYVISALVFYFCARIINPYPWFCLLISGLFIIAPQILGIDLMRIDYIVLLFLCLVVMASLLVLTGKLPKFNLILLGVTYGCLALTKMNSALYYSVFPLFTIVFALKYKKCTFRELGWFVRSFFITTVLLSFRYIINITHVPAILMGIFVDVQSWTSILSVRPYFYFIDGFTNPQGYLFKWIIVGAWIICFLSFVIKRNIIPGVISLFTLFSFAFMFFSPKLDPWGIHLLPLYLLCLVALSGIKFPNLWEMKANVSLRLLIAMLVVILLVPVTCASWKNYSNLRAGAELRPKSIYLTRLAPRQWFLSHVKKGARIATLTAGSNWPNPPIQDLGYDLSPSILRFPYISIDEAARFFPPDEDMLRSKTDIVIINDFHKSYYLDVYRNIYLLNNVADAWESFYLILDRHYPKKIFIADTPNYHIKQVEVFIINTQVLK